MPATCKAQHARFSRLAAAVLMVGIACASARAVNVRPLSTLADAPAPVEGSRLAAASSRGPSASARAGSRRRTTTDEAVERLAAMRTEAARMPSIAEQAAAMLASTGLSFDDVEVDTGLLDDEEVDVATNRSSGRAAILPFENFADGQPTTPEDPDEAGVFELRLPGVTMRELHDRAQESIVEFLILVQACLDRGDRLEARPESIVERFRMDTSDGQRHRRHPIVVLKLQAKVLNSGRGTQMSKPQVMEELQDLVNDTQCELFKSDFSFAMVNASIHAVAPTPRPPPVSAPGVTQTQALTAMALPVAASAALTGLLLWIASG